jgi:hypothetical protein
MPGETLSPLSLLLKWPCLICLGCLGCLGYCLVDAFAMRQEYTCTYGYKPKWDII